MLMTRSPRTGARENSIPLPRWGSVEGDRLFPRVALRFTRGYRPSPRWGELIRRVAGLSGGLPCSVNQRYLGMHSLGIVAEAALISLRTPSCSLRGTSQGLGRSVGV